MFLGSGGAERIWLINQNFKTIQLLIDWSFFFIRNLQFKYCQSKICFTICESATFQKITSKLYSCNTYGGWPVRRGKSKLSQPKTLLLQCLLHSVLLCGCTFCVKHLDLLKIACFLAPWSLYVLDIFCAYFIYLGEHLQDQTVVSLGKVLITFFYNCLLVCLDL